MKEFKYHQTFATKHIRIIVPEDKSKQLALASLDSLKGVLPPDINVNENPDLVFNCFNAACVNLINLNDDGITTETALAMYKQFNRKFIDLEHNRKFVVGTIISSGFSEKFTNRLMTEDEVRASNKPCNITLGGVVWSIINPKFAEKLIESSDDSSEKYETISASWEIGFNDYNIALGSKDLTQAEIISDPIQIKEFEPFLRANQGFGKTKDGIPVYRVIAGEALPLGVGYTTTPAADVLGVVVANQLENTEEQVVIELNSKIEQALSSYTKELNERLSEIKAATQQNLEEKEKNKKNNSQGENLVVNNNSIMKKFTKIEDITDENLQEATASSVVKFINDKIEEVSNEFGEKLDAEKKAKEAEAAKVKEAEEKAEATRKEIEEIRTELKKEQDARAAQKQEADFNNRMADLDSKFDLDDKDRSFIVKDITGLDDNAYAAWFEKFEVFAGAKKKKSPTAEELKELQEKKNAEKDKKNKEAQANAETLLNQWKEDPTNLPPNSISGETSMKEEYADVFGLEAFKSKK